MPDIARDLWGRERYIGIRLHEEFQNGLYVPESDLLVEIYSSFFNKRVYQRKWGETLKGNEDKSVKVGRGLG